MANFKIPFGLRLKIALRATGKVLSKPAYLFMATAVAFIVLGILVWITNIDLLLTIITSSSTSFADKVSFYLGGYESLFTNFHLTGALVLILFGILSGINFSLLVFVMRGSLKDAVSGTGKNFGAIAAAIVGAGCAACGTSFLAPFLTTVGASATITITGVIGWVANAAGIGLLLYSILGLGGQAATYLAKDKN